MINKIKLRKIVASVLAAFLVLPTAAQGVFAAVDPQITVIVEMKSEPLFAQDAVLQLNSEAQQNYSEKVESERDKVLTRAEKTVGSLEVQYTYADVFNGAAVTIRESELKALKKVAGVAEVYEPAKVKLNVSDINEEELEEFNKRAKERINLASARELGYEGEGMLIAVLDVGFETTHENFQALDSADNKLSRADVIDTIKSGALSSSTIRSSAYVSSKIPYFHSYAIDSNKGEPLSYAEPNHGTHVAGIAAGNGPVMEGVAPKAQLALMQVSIDTDEAFVSDVMAAVNDAVALGVDAMNMSIGGTWIDSEFESSKPLVSALQNVRNAGILFSISAGNEGCLYNETDNPYYATDNYPATVPGATAVGAASCVSAVSNATVSFGGAARDFFTAHDGSVRSGEYEIAKTQTFGGLDGYVTLLASATKLSGKFVPIVKSRVRYSQDILIYDIALLYGYGVVGCLISESVYNEIEALIPTMIYAMPSILVFSEADFNAVTSAKTLTVTEGTDDKMAEFSTWGFDRDLENCVDLSAPGTEIYSSVTGNGYDYSDGTSIASPFVCGASALMGEMLKRSGSSLAGNDKVTFIENTLKNTATSLTDKNGACYSPRHQGAGVMNIGAALQSKALLTDALRGGEAEIHLGTALGSNFTFSVKVTNHSDADQTYALSASFNTDSYREFDKAGNVKRVYDQADRIALKAAVTGLETPVAVKAGSSVIVDAAVALDPEQVASLSEVFENGFYVDGFIVAKGGGETLGIPATGFYGDFYALPALEDDIDISFSGNESRVDLSIRIMPRVSLSKAEAILTDQEGIVVWRSEQTDVTYSYPQGFVFSTEEEEPILDLAEGPYFVTVNVLPASRGARPQTIRDEFYYSGSSEPEILSWEMIPGNGGYRVNALCAKRELASVYLNGASFKLLGRSSSAELEIQEKTQEGYLYTGFVTANVIENPTENIDVTFYNTAGNGRVFFAPIGPVKRAVITLLSKVRQYLVDHLLVPGVTWLSETFHI